MKCCPELLFFLGFDPEIEIILVKVKISEYVEIIHLTIGIVRKKYGYIYIKR